MFVYGAILGDMIGAPYEFDRGNKSKDFPLFVRASQFTDDTVMTVAVAEALMESYSKSSEDIRQAFLEDSKVSCDVSTFGKLLRAYLCGFPQVREARLPNSKGKARGYRGIKLANYSSDIII